MSPGFTGADADDAGVVEILEGLVADVRDVARDFLGRAEPGDTRILDVDRGERACRTTRSEMRIESSVVAAPGHEGDEDVAAEGQLAMSVDGPNRPGRGHRRPRSAAG